MYAYYLAEHQGDRETAEKYSYEEQPITENGGLAHFEFLKVDQETVTEKETGKPPEIETRHSVLINYEVRFSSGLVQRNQATVIRTENKWMQRDLLDALLGTGKRVNTGWIVTKIETTQK